MVTKKDIKALDFETLSEYNEYVVDSVINGNRDQAKKLIAKFSKEQKKQFLEGCRLESKVAEGLYKEALIDCYHLTLNSL